MTSIETTISTTEAAEYVGVTPRQLRRWAHSGILPAHAIRHGSRIIYRIEPRALAEGVRDVTPSLPAGGRPRNTSP